MADQSSARPETRGEQSKVILIGVILIVIAIVIFTLFTSGTAGLGELASTALKYLIIAAVIFLIIFVVMKLLQKPKVDLVAADMQNIVDAGKLSKPPMLRDLYFTGDKEHGEFRVGKVIGFCQIQSYKDLDKIANLSDLQVSELDKEGKIPSQFIIKEDCFVFKTMPFPASLFEQPKVLRTLEDEHSQLVGDVKVYGVSMIKKFGYYWPNRAHLDIARIDHAVIKEAWRGQVHEFLKDMVDISKKSSGLDADHRKELENRKLLKIPSPLGEPESRGQ